MSLNYTPLNLSVLQGKSENKGVSRILLSLIIILSLIVLALVGYILLIRSM